MRRYDTHTIEERREIVAEYEAAPHGTKAAVLRSHGVSTRQLEGWRAARNAGLLEVRGTARDRRATPPTESAEIARLRGELARLQADLVQARKEAADRQVAVEALGKATALLHEVVSSRSARPDSPGAPSAGSNEPPSPP